MRNDAVLVLYRRIRRLIGIHNRYLLSTINGQQTMPDLRPCIFSKGKQGRKDNVSVIYRDFKNSVSKLHVVT